MINTLSYFIFIASYKNSWEAYEGKPLKLVRENQPMLAGQEKKKTQTNQQNPINQPTTTKNPATRYIKQVFCRHIAIEKYHSHSHDRHTAEAHQKDEITSRK